MAKSFRINTPLGPRPRKLRGKQSETSTGSYAPTKIGGLKSETNLVDRYGKSACLLRTNEGLNKNAQVWERVSEAVRCSPAQMKTPPERGLESNFREAHQYPCRYKIEDDGDRAAHRHALPKA